MPNDAGNQFPMPNQSEVKLTDEIAPDLSQAKPDLAPPDAPPLTPTFDQTTPISPIIQQPQPVIPVAPKPAEPAIRPATLPASAPKPFPIVTILLLLISVAATAATYFFFQQNQTLNRQLIEINQILQQQKIRDGQITAMPTPTPSVANPPLAEEATDSATPSATPTVTNHPGKAFDQMDTIIALATAKYPNAQMLMITATAAESAPTTIIKYWFRQDQTTKRYLYVLKELGKQPSLVDQQVYVTPDNNIPPLNQQATAGTLGIDLAEAIDLATATCPTTISCIANPITGLFVTKDNITRWQITYKPTDGSKPYVVQIDSTTKAILFKSL